MLDTTSLDLSNPTNPLIIDNTGVPGGITFDADGNLYTGNGLGSGKIQTGEVRVFENASWTEALTGGPPLDFLIDGTLVVHILSASPLGFDGEGNLFVGGGDFIGGTDVDFAAVVRASAVANAILGMGPADPNDPSQVRRLDPDSTSAFDFYFVNYNGVREELYLRNFGEPAVYVYVDLTDVPTLSEWGMFVLALLLVTGGTITIQHRRPTLPSFAHC